VSALLPELDQMAFAALAALVVVTSIKVVTSDEVMHAVLWLSLALIGVAGIYLTLGAEVLAALQILIYVGAVVTLILFTVMLTTPGGHIMEPQPTEEEL
jgi:NADH-quinone oxidoreductase subunit J